MQIAMICRYGAQDVFRILGRDPATSPLSPREMALFERALVEHCQAEFGPGDSPAGGGEE